MGENYLDILYYSDIFALGILLSRLEELDNCCKN